MPSSGLNLLRDARTFEESICRGKTGFRSHASILTISETFANAEPCYLSKFDGAPVFRLVLSLGPFHFLLFSIRRTRSFSSRVTKRTKRLLSCLETRILISTPCARKRKREREIDPFYSISCENCCLCTAWRRILHSKGDSSVSIIYHEFSIGRQTRLTIAERTICVKKRRVRFKRDSTLQNDTIVKFYK